jgi:ribulose-5-phosphate 4-epimerase/fuculose-1-phosphate aldolase
MTLALMLRAKNEKVALPAAIAPGTPWSDIAKIGDTYETNEWVDNVLVTWDGWLGRAALLYAHGGVVTGGDIEESVTGAFFLEENAHRAYLSCTLGKPKWIDPQMAKDASEELIRTRGPMRRVWAMVEVEGVE